MQTWFISDTHFGEQPTRRQKLSGLTGEELDHLIATNWRERVRPEDQVWHLGDIGKRWRLLIDLPGEKHLILAHASDRKPAIAKSGLFRSLQDTAQVRTGNKILFLVHDPDPYRGQVRDDIIHGHHHYRSPETGRRSVCVDHTNWAPMLLDDLLRAGC